MLGVAREACKDTHMAKEGGKDRPPNKHAKEGKYQPPTLSSEIQRHTACGTPDTRLLDQVSTACLTLLAFA